MANESSNDLAQVEEVAREFESTAQMIINRVAQADSDAGVHHDGQTTVERMELTQLLREKRQLKTERDIVSHASRHMIAKGQMQDYGIGCTTPSLPQQSLAPFR